MSRGAVARYCNDSCVFFITHVFLSLSMCFFRAHYAAMIRFNGLVNSDAGACPPWFQEPPAFECFLCFVQGGSRVVQNSSIRLMQKRL